jgi:hypothetical protein
MFVAVIPVFHIPEKAPVFSQLSFAATVVAINAGIANPPLRLIYY